MQGDLARLKVFGTCDQQNIFNNFTYRISEQAESDVDVLQTLCAAWVAAHQPAWLARHCSNYTLIGVRADKLVGANMVPGFYSSNNAGTGQSESLPTGTCRTITLYGEIDDKIRTGRVMLSATDPVALSTETGAVTPTEIASLQVLGDALILPLEDEGNTYTLVIPPNATMPYADIYKAVPRRTPSVLSSRTPRHQGIG